MKMRAFMMSCAARTDARAATRASLAATDRGGEVTVVLDDSRHPEALGRMEETWRRLLVLAAAAETPFSLLIEDDVVFNRHLGHNLARWAPLVATRARHARGRPFLASLYTCHHPPLWRNDRDRYFVAAPEAVWGAQAIVVSRATAAFLLDHWDDEEGAHDVRMPRLAARTGPVYFHVPSLVQHAAAPSTWGNGPHHAPDFDPGFRAA